MNRFKKLGLTALALLVLVPGSAPAMTPQPSAEQAASIIQEQRDTTPTTRSFQRNQCPEEECLPERRKHMKQPPLVMQECSALVKQVWSGPCPKAPGKDEVLATAREFLAAWGWGSEGQFNCLERILYKESTYNPYAVNPESKAYGLPQSLPGSKMASAGDDWGWNIRTQLKWMMDYIKTRPQYGSPCAAWAWWQSHTWY